MKNTLDSLSLSGAVVAIFFVLVIMGIGMDACGNRQGEKVWQTFGTALTTFVSGKRLAEKENEKKVE